MAFRLIRIRSVAVLLAAGTSVLVFSLTLFPARQHQIINQRANSSDGMLYPILPVISTPKTGGAPDAASGPGSFDPDTFRALSELDHKFLDDLFRSQEVQQQDDSIPNAGPTELTINAKTVRRAELVVHNEMVKRAKLVQRGRD